MIKHNDKILLNKINKVKSIIDRLNYSRNYYLAINDDNISSYAKRREKTIKCMLDLSSLVSQIMLKNFTNNFSLLSLFRVPLVIELWVIVNVIVPPTTMSIRHTKVS